MTTLTLHACRAILAGAILSACATSELSEYWPATGPPVPPFHPSAGRLQAPAFETCHYRASLLGIPVGEGTLTVEPELGGRKVLRATLIAFPVVDFLYHVRGTFESVLEVEPLQPLSFSYSEEGEEVLEPPIVLVDRTEGIATLRKVSADGIRHYFIAVDDPLDPLSLVQQLCFLELAPCQEIEYEVLSPRGKLFVRVTGESREDVKSGGRLWRACSRYRLSTQDKPTMPGAPPPQPLGRYVVWIAPDEGRPLVRAERDLALGTLVVELVTREMREVPPVTQSRQPLALAGSQQAKGR
ncbi:MAG: DUF3108 domain-containing protein [Planctomycetota bacterium]